MTIGILGIQGDISEHIRITSLAVSNLGMTDTVIAVKKSEDLENIKALIIPGGESTTISKLIRKFQMFEPIRSKALDGIPIMGTCAGCVLLAKEGGKEVEATEMELFALMDYEVERNAFGRQRNSFEAPLKINGIDHPVKGVFIRAPAIKKVWGRCKVLSTFEEKIVMVQQDNMMALSFHPELTDDTSIHEMFLDIL